MNSGLRAVPAPEEALHTFYGTINPRVITTLCSGKRAVGRAHPYRRPTTRAAAVSEPLESAISSSSGGDPEKEGACPRPVLEVRRLECHSHALAVFSSDCAAAKILALHSFKFRVLCMDKISTLFNVLKQHRC